MTNHPELKACPIPFFINERTDEQETMLEIHEHIAHGSGKARRFVCEFDSSDRKLAEITLAALNTRPSPIISEDAVIIAELREVLGIKNKADESVIDHVKEVIRINKRLFADWQKKFFEEADAENKEDAVTREDTAFSVNPRCHAPDVLADCLTSSTSLEPVSDDGLREAIKLILSRGLDNADGRDCAIIKLIQFAQENLDGK